MSTKKKTTVKKAAKKVTTKKAAPKTAKTVTKTNGFEWTDALKEEAHQKLLVLHNRKEPRKQTLQVTYHADGTATCKGIVKAVYTCKM